MSTIPKVSAIAPWYGSNRTLAEHVGRALEGCPLVAVPFAGGMSELAHVGARTLLVNDKHRHVINLARVAADSENGPRLYRSLRRVLCHPEELEAAQARCRPRDEKPVLDPANFRSLEWAKDYFICAWMARNGVAGTKKEFDAGISVRYDAGGGDSAVRFRSATRSLVAWRRILARATFTTLDAFEFLGKIKDVEGHGIYVDPPFPGPGDDYQHSFTDAQHKQLAAVLGQYRMARVLCRFYDVPMIRELYPEGQWSWARLEGRKQTNDKAPEVLLLNECSLDCDGQLFG